MPLQFVPLDQGVLGNPDGSVLVRLIPPELLVNPRMCVSREAQPTLWFPLFDCPYQAFNAVLAGIHKVFFVLDDLAHVSDETHVMAHHSIKAFGLHDAVLPARVKQHHLIVRQQTLRVPL